MEEKKFNYEKENANLKTEVVDRAAELLGQVKIEEVNGQPILKAAFVMFAFIDGKPQLPISTGVGVDPDMLSVMASNMCRVLEYARKEEKIYKNIDDPNMRGALLKALKNEYDK